MKKEQYQKAIPIIEEIELLKKLTFPNVQPNNNTSSIDVVNGKYTALVNNKFSFSRNKYGNSSPVIHNGNERIFLHEHEYNEIKKTFNKIIENRINIQEKELSIL